MLQPMPHQLAFRDLCRERKRWALFAECRTRKTLAVLLALEESKRKTVIVAPKTVARTAWMLDAANVPGLRVRLLAADTRDRLGLIHSEWDVLATNYDMFRRYVDELIAAGTRGLVVDESSKLKNPDAAITKACIRMADRMESVYVMCGTPAPNDATEYWGQLRCIADPSRLRGSVLETYWKWAYKAASPVKRDVRGKMVIGKWTQTPEQEAWVAKVLERCSTVWRRRDIFKAETPNETFIPVELDSEADVYEEAEDELRLVIGDETHKIKAEAALMKCRQIVGGSVLVNGEPHEVGTAKMEALSEILDEIPNDPCIIWFEFRDERRRLAKMMEERGESCEFIDGETSAKAHEIAARFQRGEGLRLLAHPQSCGHGVTLHRAAHVVYYSLNFSGELHTQSRDRVVNPDRQGDVAYHYLVAGLPRASVIDGEAGLSPTVDHAMLNVVRHKRAKQDAMMEVLAVRAKENKQ